MKRFSALLAFVLACQPPVKTACEKDADCLDGRVCLNKLCGVASDEEQTQLSAEDACLAIYGREADLFTLANEGKIASTSGERAHIEAECRVLLPSMLAAGVIVYKADQVAPLMKELELPRSWSQQNAAFPFDLQRVFQPTKKVGEACIGRVDFGTELMLMLECPGGYCDNDFDTCGGTCVSMRTEGQSCGSKGETCAPLLQCDPATHACARWQGAAEGESCTRGACAEGLSCFHGQCRALGGFMDSCITEGEESDCQRGLFCRRASPTDADGQCVSRVTKGGNCSNGVWCEAKLVCWNNVCSEPPKIGEACERADGGRVSCDMGTCVAPSPGAQATCAAPIASGQSCAEGSRACVEGTYCSAETSKCTQRSYACMNSK